MGKGGDSPIGYQHHQLPTRAQVVREASLRVPTIRIGDGPNCIELPEGFHRTDLLAPNTAVKGLLQPLTSQELGDLTQGAITNYTLNQSSSGQGGGAREVLKNQANPQGAGGGRSTDKGLQLDGQKRQADHSNQLEDGGGENDQAHKDSEGRPHGEGRAPADSQQSASDSGSSSQLPDQTVGSVGSVGPNDYSNDYRAPILVLDEKVLKAAYVPLSYDEGYPTLPDGRPFWNKLDFEPMDAYIAFQAYLEQGTRGNRQVFLLSNSQHTQQRIAEVRQQTSMEALRQEREHNKQTGHNSQRLELTQSVGPLTGSGFIPSESVGSKVEVVATLNGAPYSEMMEWYYLFHWGNRAKAHDLFYVDSIRRSRDMQALLMENSHLVEANKMWERLMGHIMGDKITAPWSVDEEGFPVFWTKMTPKVALDLMSKLVQIQRVSLGLPAAAPSMSPLLGHQVQSPSLRAGGVGKPLMGTGSSDEVTRGSGNQNSRGPALPSSTVNSLPAQRGANSSEAQGERPGESNISHLTGRAIDSQSAQISQSAQDRALQDDRARRIATLLDRARARKAG